ncbi:MAG TPA: hypothetical protein VFU79_05180 [Nitrososphaeraceae archaeon]|nr:hypothetical protein [Nitrososphaeraceae archaeon]
MQFSIVTRIKFDLLTMKYKNFIEGTVCPVISEKICQSKKKK